MAFTVSLGLERKEMLHGEGAAHEFLVQSMMPVALKPSLRYGS